MNCGLLDYQSAVNNNMNKKTFIFLVCLFLGAFAIGLVLRRVLIHPTQLVQIPPTPTMAPKTEPLSLPTSPVNNNPSYSINPVGNFPTKIAVVTVTELNSGNINQKLTRQLNTPTRSPNNSYIWTGTGGTFSNSGSPATFSFTASAPFVGTITQNISELDSKAKQYISSLGILSPKYSFKLTRSELFAPQQDFANQTDDLTKATVAQLDYQAYVENTPIYLSSAGYPSAWIRYGNNFELLGFSFYALPDVQTIAGAELIITYAQAVNRLTTNRGVLSYQSIAAPGEIPIILESAPENIVVDQSELAYYYSPGQTTLQPIFIFFGKGTVEGKTVQTVSLVSATP
jgi:hypothetical protein